MDLKQIEYIVKIDEERSITRAADKLFITQSALNQQLIRLEKELGTRLFERGKTECNPTEAGRIYLEGAREILKIRHTTYNRISDLLEDQRSHLSVGFTPNRGSDMFTWVYSRFHAMYPDVVIEPHELSVRAQQRQMEKGLLDVGFVTLAEQQKTGDTYLPLCREELFLILPENHPKAYEHMDWEKAFPEISLDLLREDSFVLLYRESTVRTILDEVFRKADFAPRVLFDTRSNTTVLSMVQSGQCCGVVPAYYLRNHPEGIRVFSFEQHPDWEVAAFYKKGGYLSKPARMFIQLAKECWNI